MLKSRAVEIDIWNQMLKSRTVEIDVWNQMLKSYVVNTNIWNQMLVSCIVNIDVWNQVSIFYFFRSSATYLTHSSILFVSESGNGRSMRTSGSMPTPSISFSPRMMRRLMVVGIWILFG